MSAKAFVNARQVAGITWLLALPCLLAQVPGYTITSVPGSSALSVPVGIVSDASGNLYIADWSGLVWRISSTGSITKFAGGGPNAGAGLVGDGGPATNAILSYPTGVAVDSAGNVYIADTAHDRIRKVSGATITTVAGPGSTNGTLGDGGPATSATLSSPAAIALDATGNLYIADTGHNRIRRVSLDGSISTVAGNGSASGALGDGGPATQREPFVTNGNCARRPRKPIYRRLRTRADSRGVVRNRDDCRGKRNHCLLRRWRPRNPFWGWKHSRLHCPLGSSLCSRRTRSRR